MKKTFILLKNRRLLLAIFSLSLSLSLAMAHKSAAQTPGTLVVHDNRTKCQNPLYMMAEAEPIQPQTPCQGPFYGLSLTTLTPVNTYTFDYTNTSAPGPVSWIIVTFWPGPPNECEAVMSPPVGFNFAQVGPCVPTPYLQMDVNCAYYCDGTLPVFFKVSYPCPGCIDIKITD